MRFKSEWLDWRVCLLAFSVLAFFPTGCALLKQMVGPPPVPFPKAVAEEPKIRPGITLKITIISSGTTEDRPPVIVSQAGEVSLPLINAIKCEGMTLQELQDKLKTVYAQYLHNPQVTVQFLFGEGMLSPWGTVLVKGKVGREGPVNIPPTCDLTLTRALQLAGNITTLGDQSRVKITRTLSDGRHCSTDVDVEAIGKLGKRENDYVLQANDVIWVPEIVW